MGPLRAWSMGARARSPQKPCPEAMRNGAESGLGSGEKRFRES